jgi:mRNA-degrading endonuclease RelE of RelBE toxin-antitoxin system
MRSRVTKDFRELFAALPRHVQQHAEEAYALFQQNPHHPRLHFKALKGRSSYYSARVGIHYRVLGYEDGEDIVWFWIGTHADYDKIIAQF